MGIAETDYELRRLRVELKARIDRYPAGTWSPALLRTMIGALDLEFQPRPEPPPGFRPYLVSK